jgi:hypothetical protein
VGLALGLRQGGDHSLGVEGGGWLSSERERFSREGRLPRAPPFPSLPNCKRQEEGIYKSLDSRRKSPADSLPSLGQFTRRKKKRKREKPRLGSSWPKFKFEFESFKLGLKVELG